MGLSRPRLLTAREAVRSYGVATAFLPSQATLAWIPLVALAMFGANRAIGNLRLALVCAAGHVLGTLVSEGIATYRIDTGRLPSSWAHIIDVGPSYVLVSAIVVAVLLGSVPAKVAALADFAVLVVLGHIFADLSRLPVAPIGHLTAMATAALLVASLALRRAVAARAASVTARAAPVTYAAGGAGDGLPPSP